MLTNRRRVVPKAGRAGGGSEIWGRRPRPPSASSGFPLAFRPPAKRAPNRTRPLREARLAASGDWLLLKRLASEAQLQREGPVYRAQPNLTLGGRAATSARCSAGITRSARGTSDRCHRRLQRCHFFFLVSPRLPSLTPILLLAFRGYHSQLTWAHFFVDGKAGACFFFYSSSGLSVICLYMCKLARVKC